jgi:hypothetical protein
MSAVVPGLSTMKVFSPSWTLAYWTMRGGVGNAEVFGELHRSSRSCVSQNNSGKEYLRLIVTGFMITRSMGRLSIITIGMTMQFRQ